MPPALVPPGGKPFNRSQLFQLSWDGRFLETSGKMGDYVLYPLDGSLFRMGLPISSEQSSQCRAVVVR